jgi:hypothetical protein
MLMKRKPRLLLIAAFPVAVFAAQNASAYPSFASYTQWRNAWDGTCNLGSDPGSTNYVWYGMPCDQSNIHQFFQFSGNTSAYTIKEWNGNCVDSGSPGSPLYAGDCNQTWSLDSNGELHDPNGHCAECYLLDGVEISACWTSECNGNYYDEKFDVHHWGYGSNPYPYVGFTIKPYWPANPDLVLDVYADGRANGTPVDVTSYNGTPAQFWWYDPSTLEIHLTDSNNMCLDKPNGLNDNGTTLQIWQCNGQPQQQWVRYARQYINVQSGKCLDPGLGDFNSPRAKIWDCWGGINQQWQGPWQQ